MPVTSDSGMYLRDLLQDEDFAQRSIRSGADRRFEAFPHLARIFAEKPETLVQELVEVAVQFCGADSAGISLLEDASPADEQRFHWIAISGSFAKYVNGTTPRFFSPCGTCIDKGRPQLYRVTKPWYDFLGVTADPITDGILIPWISEETRGTLWAVSHSSAEAFDFNDYLFLRSLADFVVIAIRHRAQLQSAWQNEKTQTANATVNRLAHQINNPLQSLTNSIFLASRGGEMTQQHVRQAASDLEVLSVLVKQLLAVNRSS